MRFLRSLPECKWNPLLVKETYNSGHLDVMLISFLLMAAAASGREKPGYGHIEPRRGGPNQAVADRSGTHRVAAISKVSKAAGRGHGSMQGLNGLLPKGRSQTS